MVEKKILTLDIDGTQMQSAGEDLLPGTLALLTRISKLSKLGLSVVVWTIGDETRIDSLEKAVRRSGVREAMGVIDSAAKYHRESRLPASDGSLIMERSQKLYRRGTKVPTAIARSGSISATIDDDEFIGNFAREFGFKYINPEMSRPKKDNLDRTNAWVDSIILKLASHFGIEK